MGKLEDNLRTFGLGEFDADELREIYERLVAKMRIGVERTGEATEADGGVYAFDSQVKPLGADWMDQVAEGEQVAVGNFGGTNWQAGRGKLENKKVELSICHEREFDRGEREFESVEEFCGVMVELLRLGCGEGGQVPSKVAISFGFQHVPMWTELGLDCVVPTDEPAKFWKIHGMSGRKLGEVIVGEAAKAGWEIEKIFLVNDTVATALAYPGARIGWVAGTGTNGTLAHTDHKQGHLVNLEVGRAQVLDHKPWWEEMRKRELVPETEMIAEHVSGGEYFTKQLAVAADRILGLDTSVIEAILERDGRIMNQMIRGEKVEGLEVSNDELAGLVKVSKRIYGRSGQMIGAMMAAAITVSEIEEPAVAVEGSVIWKGYRVREIVEKVVRELVGKKVKLEQVLGGQGVAALAMVS